MKVKFKDWYKVVARMSWFSIFCVAITFGSGVGFLFSGQYLVGIFACLNASLMVLVEAYSQLVQDLLADLTITLKFSRSLIDMVKDTQDGQIHATAEPGSAENRA